MSTLDNVWDKDLLWAKCQLYMQKALSANREDWEFPFWASLSMELLGRTALASKSPLLLASTRETERDARHLLYALGHTPKIPNYFPKSIDSSEVFLRCKELVEDFTEEEYKFCLGMLGRRNEELHSGGAAFMSMTESWLPRLYMSCTPLLSFCELSLEDWVGEAEAMAGKRMIEAFRDEAAKKVLGDVARAQRGWEAMPPAEQAAAVGKAEKTVKRSLGHIATCPACKSNALLEGEEIETRGPQIDGDEIVSRTVMLPVSFDCPACGLKIVGHNRLHAAGLGGTFTKTIRYDPLEFYGAAVEEPDYNE